MLDSSAAAHDTGVRAAFWMLDPRPDNTVRTRKVRAAPGEPKTENANAKAYREGCRLLDTVDQTGERQAALSAVAVFREALNSANDDLALCNGLGAALLALAQLEPHEGALTTLREAVSVFEGAVSGAMRLGVPPPTRIMRYRINQATALWMLGDRLADNDKSLKAVEILRSVIADLSPAALVDWPRAQDSLGNALMVLGKPQEATEAYKEAIEGWKKKDRDEAAQSQINLGTAYTETGHYEEACAVYREAALILTRERRPLAWGRIQHNLGTALWLQASEPRSPESKQTLLTEAIKALEAARQERLRRRTAVEWAVTTANLASAKAALGLYLASGLQPDHRLGLGCVAQAIDLYKESLAELTAPDAIKIVRGGVSHLLKLIKQQASQFRAYEIVRDHQIDMLIISRQRNDENLFNIIKLDLETTIIEMLSLPDHAILPFNMAPNSKIIADLQSVLLSSGIPRTEWPDLLAKVLSPAEIPLPGEAGQLEGAREAGLPTRKFPVAATAEIGQPVTQTADIEFPTETYSGSEITSPDEDNLLHPVAALYGLSTNVVKKTLRAKAAKKVALRASQSEPADDDLKAPHRPNVNDKPLPTLPDGLSWPTLKYKHYNTVGKRKHGAIIRFLRNEEWQSIFRSDFIVTRQILKSVDFDAWVSLVGYLRFRSLPNDIPILTDDDLSRKAEQGRIAVRKLDIP